MKNLKRVLSLMLVLCMLCSFLPVGAFAAEATAPTTNLSTSGSPFQKGTGESNSFRIPALVTLSDGTLVAAADARWNTTYDGGGLDTMVAISEDNGATWTHSFANYLGDNGNEYNGSSSTCFIDPALAVVPGDDNDTIYMLCDLYPYGIALNGENNTAPSTAVGFNDDGYLKLDYNSAGTYGYYLKDGAIYANGSTTPLSGYSVDEYFNLTNTEYGVDTNLFFADSPFKVVRTGFLYLTKSTDGGKNWSAPTLLNLKTSSEMVCLVGPGRGLVTSEGTIIFPVYSYNGSESSQRTGFIYSDDDGATWNRVDSSISWSSESAVVELWDGTLRFFYRNGSSQMCYADYNMSTSTWSSTYYTGIYCNSNTQISAISLQKSLDDKQVILVSCPASSNTYGSNLSGASYRTNGKIFLFTVGDNNALSKEAEVSVPSVHSTNSFMYSCMTMLTDEYGNDTDQVAILYEDQENAWGDGDDCYYQMSYKTFSLENDFGVTLDDDINTDVDVDVNPGDSYEKDVTLKVGETFTETVADIYVDSGSTENDIASVTWTGAVTEGGTTEELTAVTLPTSTGSVEAYISDGDGNYLSNNGTTLTNATSAANATKWTITYLDTPTWADNVNNLSRYRISTTINGYTYYIAMNDGVLSLTYGTTNVNHWHTAENGFFGGFAGTNGWQYADGSWTAVNTAGYGNANVYTVETVTGEASSSTAVTITGKAVGQTTVEVGSAISYNITVLADGVTNVVDVELKVGENKTYTIDGVALNGSNDDTSIATVTWVGTEATVAKGTLLSSNTEIDLSECEFTFTMDADGYYVVQNGSYYLNQTCSTNARIPCVTTPGKVAVEDGDFDEMVQLRSQIVDGSNYTSATPSLHFHTELANPYWNRCGNDDTIKCNEYLYRAAKAGETSSTEIPGYVRVKEPSDIVSGEKYLIAQTNGTNYYVLYPESSDYASIVKVDTTNVTTTSSTTVTITGNAAGTTTAVVGNTQYNITVTADVANVVDIELEIGESFTYTDLSGNHVDNVTQQPDGTYATMAVAGTTNTTEKKLVAVTAATFETGKRYVIENVQAKVNQPTDSVLTSEELTYTLTGLDMNGPLDVATSPTWTITPSDNMYLISRNGEYVNISYQSATMETSSQELTFEYVAGSGWKIYDAQNGIYLCDLFGTDSGEAFGTNSSTDAGNYWNIYEVVEETTTEATKVTFTGVAEGETTAVVGNTQYNITVVPSEVDDEVMNSATDIWTVDPEVQRQRYNTIIKDKYKDLYTDESWKQYETARQAAYKKLAEVTNAKYESKAEADAALAELKALVDALETAAGKLESAVTISVKYHLNTVTGTLLDTREYKIAADESSVTLPDTIVVDDIVYKVSDTTLELQGAETYYDVAVTKLGKLGGGFVASADIDLGYDHNNHVQICDLVDTTTDTAAPKKITEMTVTVGISYDLDLATDTTGMTVEWTTDDSTIATVDENGNVTAVGEGITNITATVKDADGNVVEVNTIPVTVFPKGTDDRETAIYIEDIDNTTVWCVVNANTGTYGFEVIEGELIYGQFDTTVSDGTKTTAISFFGDPDEAHALVYMKSTNSDDHYYLLHDDDGNLYDGTATGMANSSYYVSGATGGAGYWQALGLNDNSTADWDPIKDMVQWAINLGCDGGLGFTRRQSEGDLASNLSFASDPMARIEKEVDGVLPTSRKQADYREYVENMVAAVNELVYFKITVTLEEPSVWLDEAETQSAITYSKAFVTDTILPGAYLYSKELDQADGTYDGEIAEEYRSQEDDITVELNAAWTDEEKAADKRVLTYYLVYEIQESDIPKFWIDNIANLSYNYESYYSTGAQAGSADAEARISVVGSAIDNVVIDFGQSFTYQGHDFESITDGQTYTFEGLRNVHLKGVYVDGENDVDGITKCKASAKYGDVTVTRTQLKDENGDPMYDDKNYPEYEYIVTYTPHSILQEPDAVVLYGIGENNQEKVINGFLVYPATTVYYEEGFLLKDNTSWPTAGSAGATAEQTFELLGMSQFDEHGMLTGKISNKKHAYGYDPIYNGDGNNDVAFSEAVSNTIGNTTKFTFTGTGFELFTNNDDSTGKIMVIVTNAETGAAVKGMLVDTVVEGGSTPATDGEEGEFDSLPIVAVKNLDHGTYEVTLTKVMDSKPVALDGVRITNTYADSSVYTIDLEDNPEFYHLRDFVMNALNVNYDEDLEGAVDDEGNIIDAAKYYAAMIEKTEQVYNELGSDDEKPEAIITDNNVEKMYGDGSTAQDLLDNGPKNEVYLWQNQTMTFKFATKRTSQIGLKVPCGNTTYTMKYTVGTTETVIADKATLSNEVDMFYELVSRPTTDTVTYTVSITNHGENPIAITDLKICDDPSAAMASLTKNDVRNILLDTVNEVPTVDATANVSLVDYTGAVLAAGSLTAAGFPGETAVFTAEQLLSAIEMPVGYAFVDESAVADLQVVYGESGDVTIQIGKVATLKVVYRNHLGRKVGEATLTGVQTASGYCYFDGSDIRSAAPKGRHALWLGNVPVAYGTSRTLYVTVL